MAWLTGAPSSSPRKVSDMQCDIPNCGNEGTWERVDEDLLRWYRCDVHVKESE